MSPKEALTSHLRRWMNKLLQNSQNLALVKGSGITSMKIMALRQKSNSVKILTNHVKGQRNDVIYSLTLEYDADFRAIGRLSKR